MNLNFESESDVNLNLIGKTIVDAWRREALEGYWRLLNRVEKEGGGSVLMRKK